VRSSDLKICACREWPQSGLRLQKRWSRLDGGLGPVLLVTEASVGQNAATDLVSVESPFVRIFAAQRKSALAKIEE